jgi:4-amino-4-deoxychorismate lyase
MSRFIETIKLNNGVFYRLNFHQERVNKAFEIFFPEKKPITLLDILNQTLIPHEGLFKCRIVYDTQAYQPEFMPYIRREINSLKVVEMNLEIKPYKPEDRTDYNEAFAQRGDSDDVLISRNGILTDSSYTNVAFFDGTNWFTPQQPLIFGVNRAELLETGRLIEKDIKVEDLKDFQQITLFNAMIEFGEIMLDISRISL